MVTTTEPTLDLHYVLAKLRANWRTIVGVVIISVSVALLVTFLLPAKYKAEATLYFPSRTSNVLSSGGVTTSDSQGGLSGLSSGPTPIKIFHRFLESETCLAFVADKSGLKRKKIEGSRAFTEDPGASMLTVSIVLPDADGAQRLLQNHLDALSQINERISDSYLQDDTDAIQRELSTQQAKLAKAESDLVDFQKRANTAPSTTPSQWQARLLQAKVDLASTQSSIAAASQVYRKALGTQGLSPSDIPPVQKLRPKLVDEQYQLDALLTTLGPDAPEVRHLTSDIDTLKTELKSEVAAYVGSVNKGLIDPTSTTAAGASNGADVSGLLEHQVALQSEVEALTKLSKVAPTEEGTLSHLALEVSIQSDLVKQATVQLETARLQSLRDPNKWSLLDPPWVDPNPVNKNYLQFGIFAMLAGLFLSCVWAINFGKRPWEAGKYGGRR